jgi:hypothetical protein
MKLKFYDRHNSRLIVSYHVRNHRRQGSSSFVKVRKGFT